MYSSLHYFKLMILLTAICCTVLSGCGYPEVSGKTYDIAKALYSACNRQDKEQIAKIETLIAESSAAGEITSKETDWLNDIVGMANSGDWQSATAQTRKLMEDQVDY